MEFLSTSPVQSATDSSRQQKPFSGSGEKVKPVDNKVQGLVLARIGQTVPGSQASLFASASAPRVVIDLIPEIAIPGTNEERVYERKRKKERRPLLQRNTSLRGIPIGLRRCEPHIWINALIQFILFLPGFQDLLAFAPRSLQPLNEFIDQYLLDQRGNHAVCSLDTCQVVRCLMRKLPVHFFRFPERVNLFAILHALAKSAFPQWDEGLLNQPITLNPKNHLSWDVSSPLKEMIASQETQSEWLVSVRNGNALPGFKVQKQCFQNGSCYDLDAFIEYRPDGRDLGTFVAYLKIDGSWYQCDDERISVLRSVSLKMPLYRSLLLHYKKVSPFPRS